MNLERCLAGKQKTGFYEKENTEYRQDFILPAPSHKESGTLPVSLWMLTFWAEAVRTQQITAFLLYMEVRHNLLLTHLWMSWDAPWDKCTHTYIVWDTTVWIPKESTDELFTQEEATFAYIH